jgi:hypothetical protein
MLEWTGDHPRLLQREPFAGDSDNYGKTVNSLRIYL